MNAMRDLLGRPGTLARFTLTMILACGLSGCLVGYMTFKSGETGENIPVPKVDHVPISYYYPSKDPELALSFERIMRSRYHVLDLRETKQNSEEERGRFFISAERKSGFGGALGAVSVTISLLTFSLIPGVGDYVQTVVFTVRSPSGEIRTFWYSYTERLYNWLPFVLFNTGYLKIWNVDLDKNTDGGFDRYAQKRIDILDNITVRFMNEAATFLAGRTAWPTARGENRP